MARSCFNPVCRNVFDGPGLVCSDCTAKLKADREVYLNTRVMTAQRDHRERARPLHCCTCGEPIKVGERYIDSETGSKSAHFACGMMNSHE